MSHELARLAEHVLLDDVWAVPNVRADLSAAARAAFEAGAEAVPEDLRDAARLGIVRRELFGARTLTDGRAHAFLLDVAGLGMFSQVVAIDGSGLLKHAVVSVISNEFPSGIAWDISRSIAERLEWLGLLPRIGVQGGGRRHVVDFAVDPHAWETMPIARRDTVVAALGGLARDREEIIVAHRGPILMRLLAVPQRDALRAHAGLRPVYETELPSG